MEIEMFFAKYDVDGDGEFSYEEGQQLVEDLENDMIDQVNIRALLSLKNGSSLTVDRGEAEDREKSRKTF